MGESKESIEDIVHDAIHDNENILREMEEKLKAKLSDCGCVTTRERAADAAEWRKYERRKKAEGNADRKTYQNYLEKRQRLGIPAKNVSGEDSRVESEDDEWANVPPATEEDKKLMRRAEEADRERKKRLRF